VSASEFWPTVTQYVDGIGDLEVSAQGESILLVSPEDRPVRINSVDYAVRAHLVKRSSLRPHNGDERSSAEWDPRRHYNRAEDRYEYDDLKAYPWALVRDYYILNRVDSIANHGTEKARAKLVEKVTAWADRFTASPEGAKLLAAGEVARATDEYNRRQRETVAAQSEVEKAVVREAEAQGTLEAAERRLRNLAKGADAEGGWSPGSDVEAETVRS
jgi:hypothetical protein